MPSSSIALRTQECTSAEAYAVSLGAPARPCARTSHSERASARCRAAPVAMIVAIEAPEVSSPAPGACGKPISEAIQRTTARSR